ncbi:MAG: hypothetical protein M5R42_12410 [Rhodocyclaceae bacterium]|nr:hypothetical protein [Rhodocyclaceae bacterium]
MPSRTAVAAGPAPCRVTGIGADAEACDIVVEAAGAGYRRKRFPVVVQEADPCAEVAAGVDRYAADTVEQFLTVAHADDGLVGLAQGGIGRVQAADLRCRFPLLFQCCAQRGLHFLVFQHAQAQFLLGHPVLMPFMRLGKFAFHRRGQPREVGFHQVVVRAAAHQFDGLALLDDARDDDEGNVEAAVAHHGQGLAGVEGRQAVIGQHDIPGAFFSARQTLLRRCRRAHA